MNQCHNEYVCIFFVIFAVGEYWIEWTKEKNLYLNTIWVWKCFVGNVQNHIYQLSKLSEPKWFLYWLSLTFLAQNQFSLTERERIEKMLNNIKSKKNKNCTQSRFMQIINRTLALFTQFLLSFCSVSVFIFIKYII